MKEFSYQDIIKLKPIKGDKFQHLTFSYNSSKVDGDILEFGVYKGGTINHLAKLHQGNVYGFDSFEGLPESWSSVDGRHFSKGHFETPLPEVRNNVTLIKGLFDKTLPNFMKDFHKNVKLLHVDCDLYSSTTTVLELLNDKIIKGTVIVFDELANWREESLYKNYKDHEWLALKNWSNKFNRSFSFIGRSGHCQASILIH